MGCILTAPPPTPRYYLLDLYFTTYISRKKTAGGGGSLAYPRPGEGVAYMTLELVILLVKYLSLLNSTNSKANALNMLNGIYWEREQISLYLAEFPVLPLALPKCRLRFK